MYKPIIALTMGDAAGIGPEVIVKSLGHSTVYDSCRPLVIGDAQQLRRACRIVRSDLEIRDIVDPQDAKFQRDCVDCLNIDVIPEDLPFGQVSAIAGEGAYQFLLRAARLALDGEVDAICTAPLNKEALRASGHPYPGHTELLAHLTGTTEVSMLLVANQLRVIHVTTHIGLIDAVELIEPGLVFRTIIRAHEALLKSGIEKPRIAVCGINPHAGESGLFGRGEEEAKIVPAVEQARVQGCSVWGPLPADTLFFRAMRGDFDIVVAMYHDQGHGPVKVMGLEAGVNITVGLPVIRSSVDHGTAFDIAGKGIADERSLMLALTYASELSGGVTNRRNIPQ